jgi:ribosomal protein S18 acetylase RimI-like enzyme
MSPRLRVAGPADAENIALLHADSWRRHYRGALSDAYLDGDILTERLSVWSARLTAPSEATTAAPSDATTAAPHAMTVVAGDDAGLAGFVHVVFDDDARWGSLVDNLHVAHDRRRTGLGEVLLTRAAEGAAERATNPGVYLWVLEQNLAAQGFYQAMGGAFVEKTTALPHGGASSRYNGNPGTIRVAWPEASALSARPPRRWIGGARRSTRPGR